MNMLSWIDLLRKGSEVANPALWKSGQVVVNLAAFIVAALNIASNKWPELKVFTPDLVNNATAAIFAVYNAAATIITSKKVGVLPEKKE